MNQNLAYDKAEIIMQPKTATVTDAEKINTIYLKKESVC